MEGWDLYTIIEAVQKNGRKLRRGGDRLLELKAWVWHFSMHLAYALAQVCTSTVHSERQIVLQNTYSSVCKAHGARSGGQHKGKCHDQSVGTSLHKFASVHSCARQVLLADGNCHL